MHATSPPRELSVTPPPTISSAREYLNALKESRLNLAFTLIREELQHNTAFGKEDERGLATGPAFDVLAAMEKEVRDYLRIVRKMDRDHPAIYIRMLVNKETLFSPSPEELTKMIKEMREYISLQGDKTQAVTIDTAFNPGSDWGRDKGRKGLRRYLCPNVTRASEDKDADRHEAAATRHRAKIDEFLDNLEQRLQPLHGQPEWEEPLQSPLCEVGYQVFQRNASHSNATIKARTIS